MYDYKRDGYFRCSVCNEPVYEGEEYIVINGKRVCRNCIEKMFQTANYQDSSYFDNLDLEIQERLDNNGRKGV